MTGSHPLFGNKSNEEIARTMCEDGQRFLGAAYFVLGRRKTWEAAVAEFDLIEQDFYRERRDFSPVEPIFDILAQRIRSFPREERMTALRLLADTFGFKIVANRAQKVEEAGEALDRRQEREAREWLEAYRKTPAAHRPIR